MMTRELAVGRALLPPPGGLLAKCAAVLLVGCVVIAVGAATTSGPWWYTWRVWGFVLLAGAAGAATVWSLRPRPAGAGRRLTRTESAPTAAGRPGTAHPQTAHPQTAHTGATLTADRLNRLVRGMVELVEQLPSDSARYRVHRLLADAGIDKFSADGELFDAARHTIVDVEPTVDPHRSRTVARTIRPGYTDGPTVVQTARVLVYKETLQGRPGQDQQP
jgi:hypothetical protein